MSLSPSPRHAPTTPWDPIVLREPETQSEAHLLPARGGLLVSLRCQGRDLLYLDHGTLVDEKQNVRGGNPVLFPSPGKLEGDRYAFQGTTGTLPQHGFARRLPWKVCRPQTDDPKELTIELTATDETLRQFPFDFRVEHQNRLEGGVFHLRQRVTNRGSKTMPYGFGFHPYFQVPLAAKASLHFATEAHLALDRTTGTFGPYRRPSFEAGEVDLHLKDHGSPRFELRGDGVGFWLEASPQYRWWVLWTLPGKEFVCVEPWTSPGNALNSGEDLRFLEPGASEDLWIRIGSLSS